MSATTDGRDGLALRSLLFRRGREKGWDRLEDLLRKVDSYGSQNLTAGEAAELPLLYRSVMSSLSVARSIALDRHLLLYLENLALRAYLVVYGPRATIRERLSGFFRSGLPRAVREVRWHLLVATVALAAGIIAGIVLIGHDPAYYDLLMPAELGGGRGPDSSPEMLRRQIFSDWPGFIQTFIVFANSLFRHNATVALMAFGLGFMFGLPTIFLLIYNGLVVGAIIRVHIDKGLGVDFVGWLAIHGVTELLAILLASAAGLAVAQGILFPGRLPRLEGLAVKGRMAAGVAAGAVLMLFVAGIIEGGFRQLIANTPARYAFALMTGALWLAYFSLAGRRPDVTDD